MVHGQYARAVLKTGWSASIPRQNEDKIHAITLGSRIERLRRNLKPTKTFSFAFYRAPRRSRGYYLATESIAHQGNGRGPGQRQHLFGILTV